MANSNVVGEESAWNAHGIFDYDDWRWRYFLQSKTFENAPSLRKFVYFFKFAAQCHAKKKRVVMYNILCSQTHHIVSTYMLPIRFRLRGKNDISFLLRLLFFSFVFLFRPSTLFRVEVLCMDDLVERVAYRYQIVSNISLWYRTFFDLSNTETTPW